MHLKANLLYEVYLPSVLCFTEMSSRGLVLLVNEPIILKSDRKRLSKINLCRLQMRQFEAESHNEKLKTSVSALLSS